ncbi:hypothetical protein [Streptomyces fuscichromogenes]|uniref:Uncharacterized protein n=1 Tax=Streptomyces fuscichromogenes TaxID=1324013 RepID=A0A917XH45_9ACTN|nr:hypothetical protein [Streptomyces fuscichromogenes]GGN25908.1 hypothetical protein GCM10011578_060180 [Streptomyces fuscichromogenes]
MRYIRFSSVAAVAAIVTCVTGGPAAAGDDDPSTPVPCYTAALTNAISGASSGDTLSLARNCTYHLTSPFSTGEGLPTIAQPLTIKGNGATIVRDGNATPAFRIFHVLSTGNLRLQDLTVRGGNATTATGTGNGGGILVDSNGKLTLVKVDVIDNTASLNGGGVALSTNATANIRRSWVAFNNALSGGGVFSQGRLTLDNSEVGRNHAQTAGGGLLQFGSGAFIHASIISRNTANVGGGGIGNSGGAVTTIIESKIANNTTPGLAGGGIANSGAGSRVELDKSEVSGNVVGGLGGAGGGIHNSGTTTVLVLNGSKVIRNSANGPGSAVAGGIYNNNGLVTLDHSHVRNNASTTAPGGLRTNVPITLTASTITHNIPTNCVPLPIPGCTN